MYDLRFVFASERSRQEPAYKRLRLVAPRRDWPQGSKCAVSKWYVVDRAVPGRAGHGMAVHRSQRRAEGRCSTLCCDGRFPASLPSHPSAPSKACNIDCYPFHRLVVRSASTLPGTACGKGHSNIPSSSMVPRSSRWVPSSVIACSQAHTLRAQRCAQRSSHVLAAWIMVRLRD